MLDAIALLREYGIDGGHWTTGAQHIPITSKTIDYFLADKWALALRIGLAQDGPGSWAQCETTGRVYEVQKEQADREDLWELADELNLPGGEWYDDSQFDTKGRYWRSEAL